MSSPNYAEICARIRELEDNTSYDESELTDIDNELIELERELAELPDNVIPFRRESK